MEILISVCLFTEDSEFEGSVDLNLSHNFKEGEFVFSLNLTSNFDAVVLTIQSIKQSYIDDDEYDCERIINESTPYFWWMSNGGKSILSSRTTRRSKT